MKLLRIKYSLYIIITGTLLAAGYMLYSEESQEMSFPKVAEIKEPAVQYISAPKQKEDLIKKEINHKEIKFSSGNFTKEKDSSEEKSEDIASIKNITAAPVLLASSSPFPGSILQSSYKAENTFLPVSVPGISGEIGNTVMTGASDALSLVINPLRWEKEDLIKLGGVLSGTLLLYTVDNQIHRSFTAGQGLSNSDVVKFGNFYGETKTTQYAALGIGAYGLIFRDRRAVQLGLEIFESYLLANNITGLLKYTIGRSRPSENNGAYEFRMFDRPKRYCALPSGHSTLAFSLSTVLASYTDDTHLKILIYIPAFITAGSRIYENHHWASDVFLGAAIGYFTGSFIISRHNPFKQDGVEFGIDAEGRPGIKFHF